MNNRIAISPSAKVGITAVAILVVVIVVGMRLGWFELGKPKGYELVIRFDSTQGLPSGADVLLNGRRIGEVIGTARDKSTGLPVAEVAIRPGEVVNTNATAVITSESVLGNKLINITQPRYSEIVSDSDPQVPTIRVAAGSVRPNDPVVRLTLTGPMEIGRVRQVGASDNGTDLATLALTQPLEEGDALYAGRFEDVPDRTLVQVFPALEPGGVIQGRREPELTDLVAAVDETISIVQDLINDLHPQMTQLLVRVDSILAGVQGMLDEEQVDAIFADLHAQLAKAGYAIDAISGDLRRMLAESEPSLERALASMEQTTANVERTTAGIEGLVNDPTNRQRIETLLAELEGTSAELHKVMQDIEAITGDEQFQGDIKATVGAARATLEKADETLGKLGGGALSLGNWKVNGYLQERYRPETGEFATDAQLQVDNPGSSLFYLGLSEIGDGTDLDLGYGQYLNDTVRVRGGLRKGEVGVGADATFDQFGTSLDYYDFNDPKLDFFGTYELSEGWGLLFGLEDVFDDDEGNLASFGARYQF
ncbi:MAG TPA: MlaD family protein [bacterium]|nr:MlaD family protein [bacterium]